MAIPFETTSTISITLLSVIVPFFIFAITLLGNAIEKAKEEESKIKKQEQENFNNQIKDIENKIKTSKETGDSTELEKQLEKLKKNREKSNIQLKNTQKKYSLLNFKKSVVFPGSFFILAILFNESAKIYMESSKISISLWILAVVAISTGIYRLCQSLRLVQEVGITSEEFQTKKFTHAFKTALISHEKDKEEELSIDFKDIIFPCTCNLNHELDIKFKVYLKKGKIAKKTEVWFYIPDGFGLIFPTENTSWRQNNDFVIPNIRTVKIKLGNISIGPHTPGTLKVTTPNIVGEYSLMYSLIAEGYSSEIYKDQVKIIVA